LDQNRAFQLVNDIQNPGANYCYGTDSSGKKAWVPLPPGASDFAALQAQIASLVDRVAALEAIAGSSAAAQYVVITGVDYVVEPLVSMVEASAAAITVTLPNPAGSGNSNRLLTVKNLGGGDITVSCVGLLDTELSWTLADTEAMTLRSDGTIWCVV